jgi:hypothetical protein
MEETNHGKRSDESRQGSEKAEKGRQKASWRQNFGSGRQIESEIASGFSKRRDQFREKWKLVFRPGLHLQK